MIREAMLEDLPYLLDVGQKFFELTGLTDITSVDPESLETTLISMIENDEGVILIAETDEGKGTAGAISFPYYFNHGAMTGQELFWWSEGNVGAELFTGLEDWAKEKELVTFSMIALEHSSPERVGRMYQKKGYGPIEHTYTKEIT